MRTVPNLDNIKFLHPVGVSTFKYGVSIPVEAQTERMRAIEKGGKVPATISLVLKSRLLQRYGG